MSAPILEVEDAMLVILLSLAIPDLLKCASLSRRFREIVYGSLEIQYQIELFKANKVDPRPPGTPSLERRLETIRSHQKNWIEVSGQKKWQCTASWEGPWGMVYSGGVLVSYTTTGKGIQFTQVSVASGSAKITRKDWSIDTTGYPFVRSSYCPTQDLFAVLDTTGAEQGLGARIHLLSMTNGLPHPRARLPTIVPDFGLKPRTVTAISIIFQNCLVLRHIEHDFGFGGPRAILCIWDWKTGELLLEMQGSLAHKLNFIDNHHIILLWGTTPQYPHLRVIEFGTHLPRTGRVKCCLQLPPITDDFTTWYSAHQSQAGPDALANRTVPYLQTHSDHKLFRFWVDQRDGSDVLIKRVHLLVPISVLATLLDGTSDAQQPWEYMWEEWGPMGVPVVETSGDTLVITSYGMKTLVFHGACPWKEVELFNFYGPSVRWNDSVGQPQTSNTVSEDSSIMVSSKVEYSRQRITFPGDMIWPKGVPQVIFGEDFLAFQFWDGGTYLFCPKINPCRD